MKLSILAKSIFASFCWHSGLTLRLLRKRASQGFVILTYHRVIPREEAAKGVQPGMYVTPETFAQHAQFLNRCCSVVKLEQIHEKLKFGVSVNSCTVSEQNVKKAHHTSTSVLVGTVKFYVSGQAHI